MAERKKPEVVDAPAPEEAPVEAPVTSTVLVARADDEADVFRVMDEMDAIQIADELSGRPSDKMVYSFRMDGKQTTGLSYVGVAEAVRTSNEARVSQIRVVGEVAPIFREVQETDENGEVITYVECLAYAIDASTGGGNWGLARQPKFQTYRDKSRRPTLDKFATTKALSKAQRNAMEPLVPMMLREEIMARALQQPAKVIEIRRALGDPKAHELEPVNLDAEGVALREEVRAAYKELRSLAPMALPPGQFNAKLRTAERDDNKALAELRDAVVSQVEFVKAGSS